MTPIVETKAQGSRIWCVWSRKAAGACLARRLQCPLRLEYVEQKRSSPANLAIWVGLSMDHNVFPLFQSTNYTLRGSNCRTFLSVGKRSYRTSEPHMLDASRRAEFCASEITNWRTAVIGGRFCKRISDYPPLTLGKSWCFWRNCLHFPKIFKPPLTYRHLGTIVAICFWSDQKSKRERSEADANLPTEL